MTTEPSSIFTKIINREIPAHIVYEDDVCIVILDKFPGINGQSLVIPKLQVSYIFDLDDTIYQHVLIVAKKIAVALDAVFNTERTCLVIEGFEVPHVHIKLYPMQSHTPSLSHILVSTAEASNEDLERIAKKVTVVVN
jgi:histidine triad (HIT) family protein